MSIPIGIVLFLAFVLTMSVAQAQSPVQRLIAAYRDCTFAAFRERVFGHFTVSYCLLSACQVLK